MKHGLNDIAMLKGNAMPSIDAHIQTEYITETTTSIHTKHEDHFADDSAFTLVGKPEFIKLFRVHLPLSKIDPSKLWDTLLGHHSSGDERGCNPHVRYLTTQTCDKIFKHTAQFISGIDLQHLPKGFILTKNPKGGGVCDVLHYSDYIATYQKNIGPLSIILSDKTTEVLPQTISEFSGNQALWYTFLEGKRLADGVAICTSQELKSAFVSFSNTLKQLGLDFYPPEFGAALKDELNPIVLLGRWETTLKNRHLKQCDLLTQWQVLLQLPLAKSSEAIRAITDHANDENPCGFIIPEMCLNETIFEQHGWSFQNTPYDYDIHDERSFWTYISYQPKQNSLSFYQTALKDLERIGWKNNLADKHVFYRILAASTTGISQNAKNEQEEAIALNSWSKLCTRMNKVEGSSLLLIMICKVLGAGEVKKAICQFIGDMKVIPTLLFLDSIVTTVIQVLEKLDITDIAASAISKKMPKSIELLEMITDMVRAHALNFFNGSKFYFDSIKGEWNTLDIKKYTKLQQYLYKSSQEKSLLLAPLLSTFNLKTKSDIDALAPFTILLTRKEILSYCLTIFNDVQKNSELNKDVLLSLINHINTYPWAEPPLVALVDYLEQQFSTHFSPNYFAEKRQQLVDATVGLTAAQMKRVRDCLFLPEQEKAIINIESAMVRKNPRLTDDDLNSLNDHFVNLKNIIIPEDFTEFTKRLDAISDHLTSDNHTLKHLISLLTKKRTLEDFSQFYMRNKIEKCLDEHFLPKVILFIEQIKPLTADSKIIDGLVLQETLCTLVLNTTHDSIGPNYITDLQQLIADLNLIAKAHPHVLYYLIDSFNHMPQKRKAPYFKNVIQFSLTIRELSHILSAGDDDLAKDNMLTLYSLLAHYHQKPAELTTLFAPIRPLTDVNQQRFILMFVSRLLDNHQSIEGLAGLIDQFVKTPAKFARFVSTCQTPPYPDIPTLSAWISQADFEEKYATFTSTPYGPRYLDFAFDAKKYTAQADKFIGLTPATLFTKELATTLDDVLTQNRKTELSSLRNQFNALKVRAQDKPLNNDEKRSLLCLSIEILARTTAQSDIIDPAKLISQELNATQVMALYARLVNPGDKLISEIDTGEGKSRIMMIYAACQAAQGKTVDLLTSDMLLAERDYLSYKQFFTTLGIRTSLISLDTPPQLYQKGGINFSDNAQLLLLRNKSDISREPYAYLDENPERRCLLIDEVDKFTHDKSKDAYNYAASSKKLNGFVWIYPLLVDFMQAKLIASPKVKLHPESLVDELRIYLENHDSNIMHLASFASLNQTRPEQIKTWLCGAFKALHMKKDTHYKVTDADESSLFSVRDTEGHTRHTRKVYVVDNGRPTKGSSFSDGVQQCLCAKENSLAKQEQFVILPENETQRSSYPVSFMASYNKGLIFGISGTTRSAAPRANQDINHEGYEYLIVPRNKALLRDDKNTWIAKDQKQQIKFIKRAITEEFKKGCPVLLICKDDNQSLALHDALKSDKKFIALIKNLRRVHGLTNDIDEKSAIDKAGLSGSLTISTAGMFGRGVDINATNLCVLAAYVPTLEDEKQIKGRTARAGKKGTYRMIPRLDDPDNHLNGKTYNVSNEVDKTQKKKALDAVFREEVSKLYALFLEDITMRFLTCFDRCPALDRGVLLEQWKTFLGLMQKDWDGNAQQLLQLVESKKQPEFMALFSAFKTKWTDKAPLQANDNDAPTLLNEAKVNNVYKGLLKQESFFKPKRQPLKVQRKYDPSDDGQSRIYSTFFAREMATLRGERRIFADFHAWREGRGNLFPDLMAVLKGERNLFANLIATIKRWLQEFSEWCHRPKAPAKGTKARAPKIDLDEMPGGAPVPG